MLAPTAEFVAQLPGQRIPSRKDFARFNGRDSERIAAWKTALNAGQQLADEFVDWINQPNPVARIEPLP